MNKILHPFFCLFFILICQISAQSKISQAPSEFDQPRSEVPKRKIDTLTYYSSAVGTERKTLIYTPPGFSESKKYPVLYLLNGIGGDEKEWLKHGQPQVILDNLYAAKQLEPILVVMPNGRSTKDDRAVGNMFGPQKVTAFSTFEKDLITDLIPFIEKTFPVLTDRKNRALARL